MSSSTSLLDLLTTNQAGKEISANALFDAMSPAALFGIRQSTIGLTLRLYGGPLYSGGVANQQITLAASATNYVEADRNTGALYLGAGVFTPGRIPLYTIVTGTSGITSYTDWRYWMAPGTPHLQIVMSADANRTLLQYEAAAEIITLTSSVSLTATRNIVVPIYNGCRWTIRNKTLGGQALQIIGASGSGVTVTNGTAAAILADGTNIVRLSADVTT